MQHCILRLFMVVGVLLVQCHVFAQSQAKDTVGHKAHVKRSNIFKFAMNAVTRSKADTGIISSKAETPFLPYTAKTIRKITIRKFRV